MLTKVVLAGNAAAGLNLVADAIRYVRIGDSLSVQADAVRFVPNTAESLLYVHGDRLGTAQRITDQAGAVVWDAVYLPFGTAHSITGAVTYNQRFPGQYFDAETGLHYNYWRDYDPRIGRYLQADPIGLAGGANRFIYVKGNPLRTIDPSGLAPIFGPLLPLLPSQGDESCSDDNTQDTTFIPVMSQDPTRRKPDLLGPPAGGPPLRGIGGRGWRGDKGWRDGVNKLEQGGTHTDIGGRVPSRAEAEALISEGGGAVVRVDAPHSPPNPHTYPHINYVTSSGVKGTIRITGQ